MNCLLSEQYRRLKHATRKKVNAIRQLQDTLFSLLATNRGLLANDECGELSWDPYNRRDVLEQQQYLPPHQRLHIDNPSIRMVLELDKHHEELTRKRHAYVYDIFTRHSTEIN